MIITDWCNLLSMQWLCNCKIVSFKILFFCLFILLSIGNLISAQSNLANYKKETFSVNEGLPSSEVHGGFQDSVGYLWFTTDRGVARYNGYEFERFTKEDGLLVNSNIQLFPKDRTSYWLVGLNGAITEWNGTSFQPFKWNNKLRTYTSKHGTLKLIKYESGKLVMCFGFDGGVWMFNILNGSMEKLKPDNIINFPHKYTPNFIDEKVSDYEIQLFKFSRYGFSGNTALTYKNVSSFVLQNLGDTLLHHSTTALIRMNQDGQFIDSLYFGQERLIHSLKFLNKQWYVLLDDELAIINEDNFSKVSVFSLMNGNAFADIFTDQFDITWISTLDNGIIKLKETAFEELIIPNERTKKVKLMKSLDSALLVLAGVQLYVKDWSSNFVKIAKTTRLSSIQASQDKFYFNKQMVKGNGEIVKNPIATMLQSKNFIEVEVGKYLQFNTYNAILHYKDKKIKLKHPRATAHLVFHESVLIGTTDGLYQINFTADSAYIEPIYKEKLDQERVKSLITYKDYLLVAMSQSILLIDNTNSYWLNLPFLNATIIEKLYAEDDGVLWIGTNIGLIKSNITINKEKVFIKHDKTFNSAAGLPSPFITGIEKVAGELFIGTSSGLCKYKEKEDQRVPFELKIIIDSLVSNNGRLDYNKGQVLKLHADERDLRVYLDLLSFNQSKSATPVLYKLKEEGGLTTTGKIGGNYLELFSMQKGTYTLEIFQEIYKPTNDNKLLIEFVIRPKFYETILFYILMTLCSVGILIYFWRMERRKLIRKEEKKRNILKLQIDALINKMNPHFTFNVLTNIQGFIYKKNFSAAISYIGLFSQMMRKSLEYSKLETILLQDEIDFLETYLKLEQMRFPDQLNYSIEVDDTIDTYKINIPTLIIQTLVENAVKHGIAKVEEKGNVTVNFNANQLTEFLIVKITDDGYGIDLTNLHKKKMGMGLAIVQERIMLLKSHYGSDQIYIKIDNLNPDAVRKGTRIELCLPTGFR